MKVVAWISRQGQCTFTRSHAIERKDNPAAKPAKTHAQVAPFKKKKKKKWEKGELTSKVWIEFGDWKKK